jgi:hypothetical protein
MDSAGAARVVIIIRVASNAIVFMAEELAEFGLLSNP